MPLRPPLLPALERALLGVLLAATAAAVLLAGRNALAPLQAPLSFGLVFWKWWLVLYLVMALPGFLAVWLAARLVAGRWPGVVQAPRLVLAVAAAAFLAALVGSNTRAAAALFRLAGPQPFRSLMLAAFVLCLVGLGCSVALPLSRRRPLRLVALLTTAATLMGLKPAAHRSASAEPATAVRPSGQRLLLVGVDGGDWDYLDPLLARGELPHFAALKARGAWGRLKTFEPTRSPIVWTTIATGRRLQEHGIEGFTNLRLEGVLQTLPPLRGVRNVGFLTLYSQLRRRRKIYEAPVTSMARKVPAFWNIATAHGSPVNVVSWWATWPAEPVLGYVVSERTYYEPLDGDLAAKLERVTYPEALYAEIAPRIMRPEQMSLEEGRRFGGFEAEEFEAMRKAPPSARRDIASGLPYFYTMFETTRRLSLHLMQGGRKRFGVVPDTLLLFRLVDMACHTSLRHSELVKDHLGSSDNQLRKFGHVVTAAYREVDRALGDLLEAFGGGNVVIVSDHGWALQSQGESPDYGHRKAPDGMFLAEGPAFQPGRVDGLSVFDILPLMLRLKDFPVAADMAGRVPEEVLRRDFLERHPLKRIATYGRREDVTGAPGSAAVDAEMLDRLRGLGYIQ